MLTRIPFLAVDFQKGIPTMKTILTGVIFAGLFAVAGCSQTAEQPAATGTNGARIKLRQAITAAIWGRGTCLVARRMTPVMRAGERNGSLC